MIALKRGRQERLVGDERRIGAVGVGVERKAITVLWSQRRQNIAKVLHPVAIGVAFVDGLRVPGRHRPHQDLVIFVAGQAMNGFTAELITAYIAFRGDDFALIHNGSACGADLSRVIGQHIETHGQPTPQRVSRLRRAVTAAFMARPIDLNAGALDGIIHLIANHPDLAATTHCHKIGDAPSKIFIVATVRDGAIWLIAMVEATDHP